MNFKYPLPNVIKDFIENAELKEISIGCSDSQIIRVEKKEKIYFLKIMGANFLTKEYERLKWLQGKLPVPKVEMFIQEFNNDYLITEEITEKMLCDDYYINNPDTALLVLKKAFDKIAHVNINDCPFDVSNDYKLSLVTQNVKNGLIKNDSLKEETLKKFGSVENVLNYLNENKFKEELVFSHGDTSLPNIFGKEDSFKGFIDVGECGIADKWFDLAICEKSILRNYGIDYVNKFYNVLGIERDSFKVDYYLLMMELYL